MQPLDDYPLQLDEASPPAPPLEANRPVPWPLIGAVVLAAVASAAFVLFRAKPDRTAPASQAATSQPGKSGPAPIAQAPADRGGPLGGKPYDVDVPPLDTTDPVAFAYTVPLPFAILVVAVLTVWLRFRNFDPVGVVERRLV